MPTYQYVCTECSEPLEAVQSFSDPALTECPACGGRLRKVFSAVGVVFKGSGFYKTDSRSGSGDGAKGESGAGKDGAKSDAGKSDGAKSDGAAAKSDSGGAKTSGSGNGSSGNGSSGNGSGGSGTAGKAPAAAGAKTS